MQSFREFRTCENFLQMNWSFGAENWCLNTEARISGYTSTNTVKKIRPAKIRPDSEVSR